MRKRFLTLFVFFVFLFGVWGFQIQTTDATQAGRALPKQLTEKVEKQVLDEISSKGKTTFWVILKDKADLGSAFNIKADRERGEFVVQSLKSVADKSQAGLRTFLATTGVKYFPFWIANAIQVRDAGAGLLREIASRPEVEKIVADRVYELPKPIPGIRESTPGTTEWGLDNIQAPQVWSTFGVRGEGIVVANVDTGFQFDHPALVEKYRGNLGGGTFDHNYNWFDPSAVCSPGVPCDNNSHGTHTMGTMVGDDGDPGTNQIGVAPHAKFMGCKGCETNSCSDFALNTCGQFILAPTDLNGNNPDASKRPHIVNNSWGGGPGDPFYQPVVDAWVASGIFPQFSIGNSGPGCGSGGSPGDYLNTYGAGAFDINNVIAGFSGRGPSGIDGVELKPNIAAPGVNVRSSVPPNSYANFNGTSMASPHVAGTIALMWSAAPALVRDIAATRAILDSSAIDVNDTSCGGSAADNNVWGEGRLNALEAVTESPICSLGTLNGTVTDSGTTQPIEGALIHAAGGPADRETTTDANGNYSLDLCEATYDVTASAFAYLPQTIQVGITAGQTTTQDFQLDQAPVSTVTGTVSDNGGHGWGLYARIDIDGFPGSPVFTNPATGVYSVDLPEGTVFTFHVSAVVPGYFPAQRDITPGQNPTEDFALDVDGGNCNAPGYSFGTSSPLFTDDFEGGLGNWAADGLWNPENEGDTCGSLVAPFPSPTNDAYFGNDSSCTFDVGIAQGSLTTTNPINVPSTGKATLTFYSYEQTECNGECFYDNRYVEVSNDGGSTWALLADLGNENTWYQQTINLAAYSGQSILLRFRFDSIDDVGNAFFGWMVDSVDVSVTQCEAIPGGLVVGNVYDLNTGVGLNGAKVTSVDEPNDQATTFATPEDPNANDGLYVLFSSLTGAHDFTASKNQYGSQTLNVDVAAEDIVVQDFQLGTGHLVATPPELEDTVDLGSQDTQQLTITNDGNADGTFEIQEGNGLVSFKLKGPQLPKAKIHKVDRKGKGKVGPTSVMSMKNAPKSKIKALFPGKDKAPAGGGWNPTATMPNPVIRYAHAQCDETPESFYVISGVDSGFGLANTLQRYDADTDTWTTLASYPNAAEAPTAVCFQGRIYVANGAFTSNEFFIYDIATDTWLSGAALPRFVEGAAMGAVDGKIFLIGGDDDFQPADGISNEVDIYDIGTDTWTGTGSPMPEGVSNAGMVQSGPFVYVVGGWNQGSPGVNSTMTQRYDMSGDTWEVGPTFDLGNSDFALSATDTALYAAGGDAFGGGFFDPSNAAQRLELGSWPGGSWADLGAPLPEARLANNAGFCTTAASGGEVWSTGGLNPSFTVDGKNQYHTTGEGCAGAGIDVPWISENPQTATVPANGGVVVVDVTYDASQVNQPGDYFAHLTIKTDTPYPAQKVNVTMHVPLPANFGILQGTVSGLGQCDAPGGPLAGATVFIDGQLEDFTVTTDENGFYTWALDEANSPITLTVSANKYNQEVRPGVIVTAQNTTTEDFTLRLDAACLSVNPTALEDTVPLGSQDTQQFTITNDGASDANFELTEGNGLSIVKIRHKPAGAGAPVNRIKGNFSPLSKVAFDKANGRKNLKGEFKRGPQDAPWTDIANYPNAIMDSAAAEIDGLVYNVNGLDAGLSFLNTLFVYDPGADSWTQLANSTAGRERPAVAAIDGKLYVTNGWDSSGQPIAALEIYDPTTDTWSSGAPNTAPMGGGSDGLNFDGKFYVIGGCDSSNCGHTNVQIYDPASDSWSAAADYPEPISWQACGDIGGLIYCAGGTAGSSTTANAYVYDPGADSWSPVAPIPQDQWGMGYVASGDKLYISGGVTDGFSTITNEGFSYDPSSDTWTAIENSNNTLYRGAGACGFYKIGGSSGGFSPVPNAEVYPGLTECGGTTDVPWISENPVQGTIPADGGQVVIDVVYDAAQVAQPGDYFAHINVKGNSPGATPQVDVTMHVPVPPNFGLLEGTVTGLGQCDTGGGPINKATVFIDGPTADYTVETDASGHYQWYFDAANSPVDVTVSAPGYIGMTQTGVVMNPGQTTTVDFQLRLDAPCLAVDPTTLDQTLPLGGVATQQITINNTGAGDANFKIHESGGAAVKHATPKLPKAISKADSKRMAMSGPTSVRSLKNARPEKLKGIFPANSVPQVWIDGAQNPNPVIRYGHAQCDDAPESFYVISGVDTGFGLSSAMSRYDADTNSWTSLAAYPSPSEAPTAVCFEGKIYVANGAFTSNEFFVYDIASDSWSSAATLPRFVEGAAMGAFDGKIYLIGGDDDFQPASGVSNEVNIYDIATNTWTGNGATMPAATAQAGFVQAGSFVYVVGGWGLSAPGANETTTQRYDMSGDTWETGPSFDVAVADFAIAGTDTALYAMGGDQNGGGFFEPTNTAQRLDLSSWPSGSWADLGDPLPTARQANQAGYCTTAFTGGEVWTTDSFDGGSVSGLNQYRATGEGCASGSADVPWLSENPSEGVVPAGGSVVVDVTFDAGQVPAEGDYFAQLKVSGNAPGASPTVDVALHVSGGACTYSQDFNDNTMEWIQVKPNVTQPGDGFLHLDPVKKKAIGVADSSYAGTTTGVFNFDIQFSGGPDSRNWIYTHRVDKKNQMEVLFKVEQGKVVVKDRGPGGIEAKAKADFALAPNTPYNVSILYNGTAYAVTINGTTVISGFSPVGALPSANIGAAAKNNSMLLDNVCVIEQ